MAEALDPFTETHKALWSLLVGFTDFASLVAARNRLDLTASSLPQLKEVVSPADLPAAMLRQGAWSFDAMRFRQPLSGRQVFEIVLETDTMNPVKLNRVKWAAVRALAAAPDNLGLAYVRGFTLAGADQIVEETPGEGSSKGPLRSITVAAIAVDYHFPRGSF